MKKFALVLILCLVSTPIFAGTKVAIVDWKEVIDKSTATASLRRQIVTKHEELKKEFEKNSAKLKKEEEGLVQQKAVLSQEKFKERVIAFKQKITSTEKKLQEKVAVVDKAGAESLQKVKEAVSQIVKDISEAKQIELVLPKTSTIYAVDTLYITDEIIEKLNKELPDVKVKFGKK